MQYTKEQIHEKNLRFYARHSQELKEDAKRWYHDNRDKVLTSRRMKRRMRLGCSRDMLQRARKRSKEWGRQCTLTLADIHIPEFCPILGIRLMDGDFVVGSPSIDRIDSAEGYTPENTRVISWRANTLKNNATREEAQLLAIDASRPTESEIAGYADYGWL